MSQIRITDIETEGAATGKVIVVNGSIFEIGDAPTPIINYNDLTNKPVLASVATSGAYADLSGKPTLATVATSGSYADLSNKPTIPTNLDSLTDVVITTPATNQVVQYDGTNWVNSAVAYSEVTGTPTLATVATTGAYSDLIGTPTLFDGAFSSLTGKPTTLTGYGITDAVNTSALGANSGVATLDSTGKVLNTQLPALAITSVFTATDLSSMLALTTQEGDVVIRSDENKTYIKNSGTSGTITDFNEILTPTTGVSSVNGQTGVVVLDADDISGISNVGKTGAYSDLTGAPSLATVATSGSYDDLTNKPAIPTNTSDLTNDSGFITDAPVASVAGKTGVVILDSGDVGLSDVDNTSDAAKPISTATQTALDLKADISSLATVATTGAYTDLSGKPSLATVATSGSYADLSNKPTIPTNLDSLTDVIIVSPMADEVLKYNGTNWVNESPASGTFGSLNDLTDVIITSQVDGQYLTYNGTEWVNDVIQYADIAGKPSLATVATTGAYTDLTGKPTLATIATTGAFIDLDSTPTTLTGYGITDAQPLDGDLTAIAAISGTLGLLRKTGVNTWSLDNNTYLTANQTITITGDITGSGTTAITATLATVATAGTYKSVTVNSKGLVTAGTNPTTLAGYGITDAVNISTLGTANGVATLDSDGKIPSSQLSPIAITEVYSVSSEAAQLALTTQEGDIVIRSDISKTYIRNSGTSGTISDFNELLSPTDLVLSVNGYTGTVVLVKGDVGLGNVDNTSDVNKPVSTATSTALGLKEPTIVTGTTSQYWRGDKSWQTLDKTAVGLANVDNTSDTNKPVSTATQTALDLKANISSLATVATTGAYSDLTGKPTLVTNLDSLTDVIITSPSTNQTLAFNGTNWVNQSASVSSLTLDDLSDVVISTPSTNQLLQFNGTNWVNSTLYTVPASGSTGQALLKNSATSGDTIWSTIYQVPSGGSSSQTLIKNTGTAGDYSWLTKYFVPTGGSTNQVLKKNSATDGDVSWVSNPMVTNINSTASTSYSLVDTDNYLRTTATTATTITLDSANVTGPIGTQITIVQGAAGPVTISAAGTYTINVASTRLLRTINSSATLTKVSSTAWDLIGDLAPSVTTNSATTYTLAMNDQYIRSSNASATTITVPLNSAVAFPIGIQISIIQTGAGKVTVGFTAGVTINYTDTLEFRKQWSSATLTKVATDTWDFVGDVRIL